jgi:hypothetical protein
MVVCSSYGSSVESRVDDPLAQDDAGRADRSWSGAPTRRIKPKTIQHDAGQEAIINPLDPHVEFQARSDDDFEVEMCAGSVCCAKLLLDNFFKRGGRAALLMLRTPCEWSVWVLFHRLFSYAICNRCGT